MASRKQSTDSSPTDFSYSETAAADTVTFTSCDPNSLTVKLANSGATYTLSTGVGLDLVLPTPTSTLTLKFVLAKDFNGDGVAVGIQGSGDPTQQQPDEHPVPCTFDAIASGTTLVVDYSVNDPAGLPWDPLIKVIPPRPTSVTSVTSPTAGSRLSSRSSS